MSFDSQIDLPQLERGLETARKSRQDRPILIELIELLAQHPAGLRRWSVMRTIRKTRERASRDVSPKFEDEIERTFRRFCAEDMKLAGTGASADALFFRPKEKAGEVWAVYPDRVAAWLEADRAGAN